MFTKPTNTPASGKTPPCRCDGTTAGERYKKLYPKYHIGDRVGAGARIIPVRSKLGLRDRAQRKTGSQSQSTDL
ncbi:unnamed protein product, partial [Iphiclides podalirius]